MSSPPTLPKPETDTAEALLRAGEVTQDAFLGGRLSILQPRHGHRSGSDAVFLAAAVPAAPGEAALELGAGVGVAGLCLLARAPSVKLTALDADADLGALAATNAARNGLADRCEIVIGDVTGRPKDLAARGLRSNHYQHVFANPPFYLAGSVRTSPESKRSFAHIIRDRELDHWVRVAAAAAAPDGSVTFIHRPQSLAALLELLDRRFGDIAVFPLFPRAGLQAARILVQGRKGSRAPLRLLPGLVLHEPAGAYTAAAEAILRGGEALPISGRA